MATSANRMAASSAAPMKSLARGFIEWSGSAFTHGWGQLAPYSTVTVVNPPSGATETWTRQPFAGPVDSSTKLPSSSGPESASVLYDACSSFDRIQSATVFASTPSTASTADAGPLAASSAGVEPA